ncbi:MAG: RNA polymerase sigma factor [Pseudomonadota bacterium]
MTPRPHAELDEQALARLANHGEEAAFVEIMLRHRDWASALAFRFTADRDDALDVMQEAFVELFARFPGFVLRASLRAFLYPVIKHRCISLFRKRRKVVRLDDHLAGRDLPDLRWEPPAAGDFERMIQELPETHREVVRLRFALDFSLDEIAQALDLPLGTVKSRLHNALKKLQLTTEAP